MRQKKEKIQPIWKEQTQMQDERALIPGIKEGHKNNAARISEIIFYSAVVYAIGYDFFLGNTMFAQEYGYIYLLPLTVFHICEFIILDYAIYSVITEQDRKIRIVYAILSLVGAICIDGSGMFFLLCVAFSRRSMKKAMMIGFISTLTVFIVTIASSFMGIIGQYGHSERAFALGMVNRTNFAFAVLFLIISYAIIKNGRLKIYEYAVIIASIVVTYKLVHAKNAAVCMTLFTLLCLGSQVYERHFQNEKLDKLAENAKKYFLDYSNFWAVAIYGTLVAYRSRISDLASTYQWLGSFTYRLTVFDEVRDYPLTLFGQGLSESGNPGNYFVIDSFCLRSPISDGLIVFALILGILTFYMIKARRSKCKIIYSALLVMALFSITDAAQVDWSLNLMCVMPFAIWDTGESSVTGGRTF